MKSRVLAAILVSLGALCGGAQAQSQVIAYSSASANMFAGPSEDYPVVAVLPPGVQVAVQGCLPDYTWCDVIAGYDRGWVYAGAISSLYDNTWQPMIAFAPVLGVAVLPFVLADYWPRHYWNRPFFAERARWWNVPHAGLRHRPGVAPPEAGFRHRPGLPPPGVAGWRHQPPAGRVGPQARLAPPVRVAPPVQPVLGARPAPAAPRFVPQQQVVRPAPHVAGGAAAPARGGWSGSGGGGHSGDGGHGGGRGHGGPGHR